MALTNVQLEELRIANPFFDEEAYKLMDFEITSKVNLTTEEVYVKLLEFVTTSLGVLQYILEEPDEVLLNVYPFRSGGVVAGSTPVVLEEATTSSKTVQAVIVTNYQGSPQGIAIYHVLNGTPAPDFSADAIIWLPEPMIPVGTTPIKLNLMLRPGDQLRVLSTKGSCAFVAYITV
jgi:hypothetical protein